MKVPQNIIQSSCVAAYQGGFGMIPDRRAAEHHLIRVIDESEEDYLYPESYFVPIELPEAAEKAFSTGYLKSSTTPALLR